MVLALSTLFIVDGFQCRVSANARNSREPERSSEIRRTAFRHFIACTVEFSGLLYGRIYSGKSGKFIGGFKPRNIAYFGKERGCKRRPHTHNCIEFAIKGSELFGYEKGAFTGASQRRIGRFEAADKGTIFLDEIGEIDAQTQVKLLRFLETKSFERLGSTQNISVDVRIICATNRDLKKMSESNEFREDLYYRLNVVEINIPPLREHPEDIEPLLKSYIKFYAVENETPEVELMPDALEVLRNYYWGGNIRELRNFCENIVVMSPHRKLYAKDLDAKFKSRPAPKNGEGSAAQQPSLLKSENEAELIKKALETANGNKSKAAELLGISRRTIHRKLSQSHEKQG